QAEPAIGSRGDGGGLAWEETGPGFFGTSVHPPLEEFLQLFLEVFPLVGSHIGHAHFGPSNRLALLVEDTAANRHILDQAEDHLLVLRRDRRPVASITPGDRDYLARRLIRIGRVQLGPSEGKLEAAILPSGCTYRIGFLLMSGISQVQTGSRDWFPLR